MRKYKYYHIKIMLECYVFFAKNKLMKTFGSVSSYFLIEKYFVLSFHTINMKNHIKQDIILLLYYVISLCDFSSRIFNTSMIYRSQ